ncbi:collagen-like triple helix repeat-containing protein [Corynebacterium minutissimum]|uniref:Adhesin n=2 Tax=Corynebacterium minutissimum TaxID=38301 RepID=A0A376CYR3_9CORY|nr:collagen-like protein [Corynebacterium minutissimum]QRP60882.1 collagen-like protein [Corynebacterium minutissimum]STC77555.1 adhesin [Corynebacterium minutissimum]
MARITGTLKYVTTRPEDVKRASVRAPRAREHDGAVITTSTDYVDVVDGRLEFDAAPGPVVVTLLRARGPVEVLEMIVPEGGGSLAAAVGAAELADSATRSQLDRLASDALEAVRESKEAASSAKASLGELKALESNAEGLLSSAAEAASRAEKMAASTSWNNDVLTVNGQSSPPLTGPKGDRGPKGPPGDKGDRGDKGDKGEDGVDGTVKFEELTEQQLEALRGAAGVVVSETEPENKNVVWIDPSGETYRPISNYVAVLSDEEALAMSGKVPPGTCVHVVTNDNRYWEEE